MRPYTVVGNINNILEGIGLELKGILKMNFVKDLFLVFLNPHSKHELLLSVPFADELICNGVLGA